MKPKNRGIRLIALVITIIILLILSAVTIATLSGENRTNSKSYPTQKGTNTRRDERTISIGII